MMETNTPNYNSYDVLKACVEEAFSQAERTKNYGGFVDAVAQLSFVWMGKTGASIEETAAIVTDAVEEAVIRTVKED